MDWRVKTVNLKLENKTVWIYLEHKAKKGYCSKCNKEAPIYNLSPERSWRHLDTMYCTTMLKVASMIEKHLANILTYFDSSITNAIPEGINSKIQSLKSAARGFRSFANYRTTILFYCGKLNLVP